MFCIDFRDVCLVIPSKGALLLQMGKELVLMFGDDNRNQKKIFCGRSGGAYVSALHQSTGLNVL